MALPPHLAGLSYSDSTTAQAVAPKHTLEIYLDYVCPFSKKLFNIFYETVIPSLSSQTKGKLNIIFRLQVQPWHPSSTLVHESALAVQRLSPQSFWAYSARLFAHQTEFFDVAVVNETRNATYRRLAELAAEEPGIAVDAVYDLLKISDVPDENGDMNVGNAVTQDLKTVIKMARLVGVHVSPTVIFDGVVENAISSSWTKEQWNEFLEKRVV